MKVSKIIVSLLIISAALITPVHVLAQVDCSLDPGACGLPDPGCLDPNGCGLPDPGGDPDAQNNTQAPFDAGLSILLGVGAVAAFKRRRRQ